MFASDWVIKLLNSCSQWRSDGTFEYRPILFYYLTTKKEKEIYIKNFQHLLTISRQRPINLNPKGMTCDYELATINAVQCVFPSIYVAGFFFLIIHNHF